MLNKRPSRSLLRDCETDGALHRLVITARLAHCAGDKYTSLILGHTASSQDKTNTGGGGVWKSSFWTNVNHLWELL